MLTPLNAGCWRHALLWCAMLLSVPSWAEPEVRVIPLKHHMAEELIPVLRPLLAPGESITGMDTRLVVRASRATQSQINHALGELDRPRRNLRISVRHGGDRYEQRDAIGAAGEVRQGNTRIVVTGAGSGSITTGPTGPDSAVRLHAGHQVHTTRDSSIQTLVVLDGGRGYLRIGESIPQVQTFLALAGHRLQAIAGIQYQDVTTGFDVEPRLLGEQVHLVISPRLAFRSAQGAEIVNFQELRTTVTMKPGEWTEVGSAVGAANEVNRQIFSTRRLSGEETSQFWLRVDAQ